MGNLPLASLLDGDFTHAVSQVPVHGTADKRHVKRNLVFTGGQGLEVRSDFVGDVTGSGHEVNKELEKAGRVADFFELGELMCRDALAREESAGGHFREEYQTPEGEAQRDDENFCYTSAWQWKSDAEPQGLVKEPLTFDYVKPTQRSYK